MNSFEKLGLPETATPQEVTAAWRKLCMIHHPDRGGNAVEFCEVRRAYKEALAVAVRPKTGLCETCRGTGRMVKVHGFNSISVACTDCGGKRSDKRRDL